MLLIYFLISILDWYWLWFLNTCPENNLKVTNTLLNQLVYPQWLSIGEYYQLEIGLGRFYWDDSRIKMFIIDIDILEISIRFSYDNLNLIYNYHHAKIKFKDYLKCLSHCSNNGHSLILRNIWEYTKYFKIIKKHPRTTQKSINYL